MSTIIAAIATAKEAAGDNIVEELITSIEITAALVLMAAAADILTAAVVAVVAAAAVTAAVTDLEEESN